MPTLDDLKKAYAAEKTKQALYNLGAAIGFLGLGLYMTIRGKAPRVKR